MQAGWWSLTRHLQISVGSLLAQGSVYEWHWEMHPM